MALGRVISFCRMGRVRRMGTSLNVSAPPAITHEACPHRIFSAALVMATLEEMHACSEKKRVLFVR
jgi:hypothetical protein